MRGTWFVQEEGRDDMVAEVWSGHVISSCYQMIGSMISILVFLFSLLYRYGLLFDSSQMFFILLHVLIGRSDIQMRGTASLDISQWVQFQEIYIDLISINEYITICFYFRNIYA